LGIPVLTLRAYLQFWALVCAAVSLGLLLFVHEDPEVLNDAELNTAAVYQQILAICRLPHVQVLLLVHLVAKVGFQANDAVTSLKMVERGLGREDLAIAVLVDFPFQIVGGWLAARWSTPKNALRPWVWAYGPRLLLAGVSTLIVRYFPTPPISQGFFLFLIVHTVLQSFAGYAWSVSNRTAGLM
jgi:PAT family acetyl-CoA transporter-like MFS transporter 1